MLIDWFTVGAQVINFVILVWLLKHFLYQPILKAIDSREERIALAFSGADAKSTEAQKERDKFHQKNVMFDEQHAELMSQAEADAKIEYKRLVNEARQTADNLSLKQQKNLASQAQALSNEIGIKTQQEVFAIVRKALTDLTTKSLEECLTEVFIQRLLKMDSEMKVSLTEAFKTTPKPGVLMSAFDLPSEQQAAIQDALNKLFSYEINIGFEVEPKIISGIELSINGLKVGWSIANYIASLEESVVALLDKKANPEENETAKIETLSEGEA